MMTRRRSRLQRRRSTWRMMDWGPSSETGLYEFKTNKAQKHKPSQERILTHTQKRYNNNLLIWKITSSSACPTQRWSNLFLLLRSVSTHSLIDPLIKKDEVVRLFILSPSVEIFDPLLPLLAPPPTKPSAVHLGLSSVCVCVVWSC